MESAAPKCKRTDTNERTGRLIRADPLAGAISAPEERVGDLSTFRSGDVGNGERSSIGQLATTKSPECSRPGQIVGVASEVGAVDSSDASSSSSRRFLRRSNRRPRIPAINATASGASPV